MNKKLNILAIEPFYGGSHQAFLDDWISHSRHHFTIISQADQFWRWRLKSAALLSAATIDNSQQYDLIFCSSLLNLAEFYGLLPCELRTLPSIAYFHENQLTYPVREGGKRDANAVFANLKTAVAATECWWNSSFNCNSFFDAFPKYLARMPENEQHHHIVQQANLAHQKSRIMPLGIEQFPKRESGNDKPLHIVWAARWEHDKRAKDILDALTTLTNKGLDFKFSMLGEQPIYLPPFFQEAEKTLHKHILHWGHLQSRHDYLKVLKDADVIVSTSNHEFFGISILEGAASGAFPLLPDRLVYPEIFCDKAKNQLHDHFYDGTVNHLQQRIEELIARKKDGKLWQNTKPQIQEIIKKYNWQTIAKNMDDRIQQVTSP